MQNYVFPLLKADDIECRIGNKSKDGKKATILLYKTARTDAKYLDQVVGAFNWQKKFYSVNGFTICSLGIKDTETNEWVWKDDAGGESNIEKEKGTCSDAFKRAGFAWGVGRELYSAPTIWVELNEAFESWSVKEIAYNEQTREITKVVIVNNKGEQVYPKVYNKQQAQTNIQDTQPKTRMINDNQKATINYHFGLFADAKLTNWLNWCEKNFGTRKVDNFTFDQATRLINMINEDMKKNG